MDYVLFIIGIIMLVRNNMPWTISIIIFLASIYPQLGTLTGIPLLVGPKHDVADVGLLLYIIFFWKQVTNHGIYTKHPLKIPVVIFSLYLILNGCIDICQGILFGDVIRYLRKWIYLSLIFISPCISRADTMKTIRIILGIMLIICITLSLQYCMGITLLGSTRVYMFGENVWIRGVRPPNYTIFCLAIVALNLFNYSSKRRIIESLIFLAPILLALKMSYFTTILITLTIFYAIKKGLSQNIKIVLTGVFLFSVLCSVFPVFESRLSDTVNQLSSNSKRNNKEGNFKYRIDYFAERFDYVMENPVRFIRGIGYVQEKNFHEKPFRLGQPSAITRKKAQLDTDDIAWTLLMLRLGMVGLALYLCFYVSMLKTFYEQRKSHNMSLFLFAYFLAALLFWSIAEGTIANCEFFILPLLFCAKNEDNTLYLEF